MHSTSRDRIILVNDQDIEIGTGEKVTVHEQGLLHRAFSIFVFNMHGDYLLQKRSVSKYHSGGLWTNTCCSHPGAAETLDAAVHRRLVQEMGFDCGLTEIFSFVYRAEFPNGLIEHEYDHVFSGTYEGAVDPDPAEVEAWEWVSADSIRQRLATAPGTFTPWFTIAFDRVNAFMNPGKPQRQ